jgi:UDP-3-O-acyl-N-acetylglucosamine deacetylase
MEDKRSIKKVLESQGDMHEKVANQSNSELLSLTPTQSPGIAYDLHFGRSTYAWKAKEIKFPMALVSYLTKISHARSSK